LHSGPKYSPTLRAQPRIWLSPINKILFFLLIGELMGLFCFENIFFLIWC
jgi:hypothetical protein